MRKDLITIDEKVKLFVRGKSKTGSKSYSLPLTQRQLASLGISNPDKQRTIYLHNDDAEGLSKITLRSPQSSDSSLIFEYMKNVETAAKYWAHYDPGYDDPFWPTARCLLVKATVLNKIYDEIKDIDEDTLKENLLASNCQEIIPGKTIVRWLNEVDKQTTKEMLQQINSDNEIDDYVTQQIDNGNESPIKYLILTDMMACYRSIQALSANGKTLNSLAKQMVKINNAVHEQPSI